MTYFITLLVLLLLLFCKEVTLFSILLKLSPTQRTMLQTDNNKQTYSAAMKLSSVFLIVTRVECIIRVVCKKVRMISSIFSDIKMYLWLFKLTIKSNVQTAIVPAFANTKIYSVDESFLLTLFDFPYLAKWKKRMKTIINIANL